MLLESIILSDFQRKNFRCTPFSVTFLSEEHCGTSSSLILSRVRVELCSFCRRTLLFPCDSADHASSAFLAFPVCGASPPRPLSLRVLASTFPLHYRVAQRSLNYCKGAVFFFVPHLRALGFSDEKLHFFLTGGRDVFSRFRKVR